MMSAMINAHDLSPSLWNVASCFYTRNLDLEDAFCVPLTLSTTGPWIGMWLPDISLALMLRC